MAEYIEREAVVKRLEEAKEWCKKHLAEGEFREGCIAALDDERFNLTHGIAITTADVVDVKHGRWIYNPETIYLKSGYTCSACRHPMWHSPDVPQAFNYCPNCGAKMDLKEGAEE